MRSTVQRKGVTEGQGWGSDVTNMAIAAAGEPRSVCKAVQRWQMFSRTQVNEDKRERLITWDY